MGLLGKRRPRMRAPPVALIATLALLLVPPVPTATAFAQAPYCLTVVVRAEAATRTEEFSRDLDRGDSDRCDVRHWLNLTVALHEESAAGALRSILRPAAQPGVAPDERPAQGDPPGPAAPPAGPVPAPAPAPTAPGSGADPRAPLDEGSASFALDFHVDWGLRCEAPHGSADLLLQGVHVPVRPDGAMVDTLCGLALTTADTDPTQPLMRLALDALDLVIGAVPTPDPAWSRASEALSAHLLSVPAAPLGASAPADTHADDGEGIALDGSAAGIASPDLVALDPALAADTPHAEAAPESSLRASPGVPAQTHPAVGARPAPTSIARADAAADRAWSARPLDPIVGDATAPAGPTAPPAPAPPPASGPPRASAEPDVRPLVEAVAPIAPPSAIAALAASAGAAALAWAFWALYQRVARPGALAHPLRAALHDACAREGRAFTVTELAHAVGAERKTTEYHLRYLVRLGLLREHARSAGALYAIPALALAARVDALTQALHALARERPGFTTREAAASLGLTRPRAERRLRELATQGRLVSSIEDGERRYFASS